MKFALSGQILATQHLTSRGLVYLDVRPGNLGDVLFGELVGTALFVERARLVLSDHHVLVLLLLLLVLLH